MSLQGQLSMEQAEMRTVAFDRIEQRHATRLNQQMSKMCLVSIEVFAKPQDKDARRQARELKLMASLSLLGTASTYPG